MTTKLLNILTGINRTATPSSGSLILTHDLYSAMPETHTTFLGRSPVDQVWKNAFDQLVTLTTTKHPQGPDFEPYVHELTREVGRLIAKIQPDAIHAQYLGFALSLAFARAAGDIPVIAIGHGPDVTAAEHDRAEHEVMKEVAAASTAIVAPTPALADRIDRLTGCRFTDRLTVIPWGIPLINVRTLSRPPTEARPLSLVHAGRLDDNKSTITAVEALAKTDQPHHLTVIGDGVLREHLKHLTIELGLRNRVHFAPFLPRAELWRHLPNFDAFVFTTKGTEAFGLILIEAQAHGLPIAYSDLPGVRETLGNAGIPYTPGDPHSLAVALDEMSRNVHRRQTLAQAGLRNAHRYDITTTSRRLRELTLRSTIKTRTEPTR
ncbi:glycosyltransferase family 4 protein [Streptomyces sp. NPDC017405]|uniref:glycosyltransferase family 4 protein n=1 Tax=unclassified Streptomyces TaxID=2593676 RepID=UPI0037B3DE41